MEGRALVFFAVMVLTLLSPPVDAQKKGRKRRGLGKVDESEAYANRIKRGDVGMFGALRLQKQHQKSAASEKHTPEFKMQGEAHLDDKFKLRKKQEHLHEVLRQTLYNRK